MFINLNQNVKTLSSFQNRKKNKKNWHMLDYLFIQTKN